MRTFAPAAGVPEDPACGIMNAAVGQWLATTGAAPSTYRVSQGTRLGRAASIEITADTDGTVWVSGAATICIRAPSRCEPHRPPRRLAAVRQPGQGSAVMRCRASS
ncbi:PhzF family phenazine biosynthesis protein [Streptomyces sp. NPDC058695]|uniref:PhzF family phenazine biosynthesis protein n=1 Tax=Streptomyces sp. NPDC058695 TaxID=3346604 RepID=UPI0036610060